MRSPQKRHEEVDAEGPPAVSVHGILSSMGWGVVLPLAAAVALGFGALGILKLTARPLALLIIAITIAEALAPLVDWLERRLHRRVLSLTIVYLTLAIAFAALGWIVVPPLAAQGQELLQRIPTLLEQAQSALDSLDLPPGLDLASLAGSLPSSLGGVAVSLPITLFGFFLDLFVVIFLSVYWLLGRDALKSFTLSLIPEPHRAKASSVIHEIGQNMGGYVRGAFINAAIMGVLAWIGLTLIGMPYAVVLGVLTMIGEVVPVLGPVLVGAIVTGLALLHSLTLALIAAGLFIALEQIEGHLLTPNIMRSQTQVPQTLVLFAIVVGAALGGVIGLLVAIPIAAALRVFVLRVAAPAERHSVIQEST